MGTVRTLIGYVKGPKGDTGATGATGPQGPAGQDGAPGVTDYATTERAGLVRVGDDFNINSSNGTLSIKNLFTTASTLAKMVSEEAFATSLGKIAKAVDWVVDNSPNFFNKNTDIVDELTSSLTTKALSANAGKALKDGLDSLNGSFTINPVTVTYDTTKLDLVTVFKMGKIAFGVLSVKANVLGSGYNAINFSSASLNWHSTPTANIMTTSTTDDSKNYRVVFTSTNGMQIRASGSNVSTLQISFIGVTS